MLNYYFSTTAPKLGSYLRANKRKDIETKLLEQLPSFRASSEILGFYSADLLGSVPMTSRGSDITRCNQ